MVATISKLSVLQSLGCARKSGFCPGASVGLQWDYGSCEWGLCGVLPARCLDTVGNLAARLPTMAHGGLRSQGRAV